MKHNKIISLLFFGTGCLGEQHAAVIPIEVKVKDIDSDGDFDLVATVFDNPSDIYAEKKVGISQVYNDNLVFESKATFINTPEIEPGDNVGSVNFGLVDFNNDSRDDIVLSLSNSGFYFFINNNGFVNENANLFVPQTFSSFGIDFFDINQDSLPDFITTNLTSISVFLISETISTNDPFSIFDSNGFAAFPTSIDIDNDGIFDEIWVAVAPGDATFRIVRLVANPDQTFTEIDVPVNNSSTSIFLSSNLKLQTVDIDNDGFIDVFASSDDGSVILKNNGNTSFDYIEPSTAARAIGDINGDGALDLVTKNAGLSFGVQLNTGGITFASEVAVSVNGLHLPFVELLPVDAKDMDGDQDLDVICQVNSLNGPILSNVIIFLNNGDGTFTDHLEVTLGLD